MVKRVQEIDSYVLFYNFNVKLLLSANIYPKILTIRPHRILVYDNIKNMNLRGPNYVRLISLLINYSKAGCTAKIPTTFPRQVFG